jgi:hypothetical protein
MLPHEILEKFQVDKTIKLEMSCSCTTKIFSNNLCQILKKCPLVLGVLHNLLQMGDFIFNNSMHLDVTRCVRIGYYEQRLLHVQVGRYNLN